MSSSITVTGLGKAYKQYPSRWARLKEWLSPVRKPRHQLHWVLKEIDFTVAQGEAVGIVGVNGAGKSTLLKIITGTTRPTTGSVQINGRIAALLELGMGFHPDFTGRQNVFMAGQLLGYSAEEIGRLMPDIEAFAEIGDYIDQPVRIYSSGMQVRLAFSVATAVRPDILIVDEALSVGDRYFSQKAFNRIHGFLNQGTTLLFVSHDATSIKALCDRAILMENGSISMIGNPETVIDRYNGLLLEKANQASAGSDKRSAGTGQGSKHASGKPVKGFRDTHAQIDTQEVVLTDFAVFNARGEPTISVTIGDTVLIRYTIQALTDLDDLYFGISIRNNLAISIFNSNSHAMNREPVSLKKGEYCSVSFKMKLPLQVGQYGLCIGVAAGGGGAGAFDRYLLNIINAEVLEIIGDGPSRFGGVVDLNPTFEATK
ncbi:ABC transporter ATP-binding protein [Orrella sp. JC864]|uniref:ABC transporter ATP-binding protein n=1 Tax=Orrella sp. JC864 TaxID=3120298 RepID=UPI00300BD3AE